MRFLISKSLLESSYRWLPHVLHVDLFLQYSGFIFLYRESTRKLMWTTTFISLRIPILAREEAGHHPRVTLLSRVPDNSGPSHLKGSPLSTDQSLLKQNISHQLQMSSSVGPSQQLRFRGPVAMDLSTTIPTMGLPIHLQAPRVCRGPHQFTQAHPPQ